MAPLEQTVPIAILEPQRQPAPLLPSRHAQRLRGTLHAQLYGRWGPQHLQVNSRYSFLRSAPLELPLLRRGNQSIAQNSLCRSVVLYATSLWLRFIFPDIMEAIVSKPTDEEPKTTLQVDSIAWKSVLWISRRNFEATAGHQFTSFQRVRTVRNDDEIIMELHKRILEWNNNACLRSNTRGKSAAQPVACTCLTAKQRFQGTCGGAAAAASRNPI